MRAMVRNRFILEYTTTLDSRPPLKISVWVQKPRWTGSGWNSCCRGDNGHNHRNSRVLFFKVTTDTGKVEREKQQPAFDGFSIADRTISSKQGVPFFKQFSG